MSTELLDVPAPLVRSREARRSVPIMPALPLAVLAIVIFLAVAAPLVTPYEPTRADLPNSLLPPAWVDGGRAEHLLGTDTFGRDSFARLIYGGRVSLSVAFLSLIIATLLGTSAGLLAGYAGGVADSVLMRFVDMVLSLPTLLIALAMSIALGPSFTNLVLVIGFLIWPRVARLVRSDTLVLKHQEFVRYARAVGVPGWLIVLRHILPNVTPTLLVAATLEVGHVILVEASLSFLGAGIPSPQPSWGVMISDGRALIATGWWIALFPGLALVVSVISFNTLGDWLRDRLDPKLRDV
jgi:ABC-type dipeptide/oligopeptide/nickel transport system permease subunit